MEIIIVSMVLLFVTCAYLQFKYASDIKLIYERYKKDCEKIIEHDTKLINEGISLAESLNKENNDLVSKYNLLADDYRKLVEDYAKLYNILYRNTDNLKDKKNLLN